MSDYKISQLTQIAAAALLPAVFLPVVDPNDTSTPPTGPVGSDKKMTIAQLTRYTAPTAWVNFAGTPYFADPTGTADGTTAINDALAATPAGGVCYAEGGGNFKVSGTLTVPDSVTLLGDLTSSFTAGSVLAVADGANLDAVISDSTWASSGAANSTAPRVVGIVVSANGANQTAGQGIGIAFASYRGEVIGCRIQNTRGDGIRVTNVNASGTTVTGSIVECKVYDNTVENAGLGDISGNTESIAFRDSGAGAVTDYWCQRNVVYSNTYTNGSGIWNNSASGAVISDNHSYGMGLHGIYCASGSTSFRITDNYVEYFGQKPSSGTCYGIYAVDAGNGPGTVIHGNVVNIDNAVTGNTFVSIYLTNPSSGAPAHFGLGVNNMSSAVAAATALEIENQGSTSAFVVAMSAQAVNGFTSPYAINNFTTIRGTPFAGFQQPAFASTLSVDPTQGTTVEVSLTGNLVMDLPAFFPAGMIITFIFQQPSAGGAYSYTATFTSSGGYSGGGAWKNVTFTAATGANAMSAVSFASDGYNLVQAA